nr:restriction endonuclease [Halalkaliarchaeum desulfuricum]
MTLLDELSGFEFEELMVDVFRHQGYDEVRQAVRTADEGRDVTMIDRSGDGPPTGVVVECKHTDTVGRPVVQKLHSAVKTYDFDGPKRGMVATTGRFTGPAEEYARRVSDAPGDVDIHLLDGRKLREIGEGIGMDLKNGRIEVLCEETLSPPREREAVRRVRESADRVSNLEPDSAIQPEIGMQLFPALVIDTEVTAVFETSVGVIHAIDDQDRFLVRADREGPGILTDRVEQFVIGGLGGAVPIDDVRERAGSGDVPPLRSVERFWLTETEYRDWAVERQRDRYETTVRYTGDNNVTYERTCTPNRSDVVVTDIEPVYVPHVKATAELGEYAYDHASFASDDDAVVLENEYDNCVRCGQTSEEPTFGDGALTFCENCGSINCGEHVRTERLVDEPVCTGCSVTGTFFFAEKHFYDEENLETFSEEYAAMPFYRKPLENPKLVAAAAVALVVLLAIAVGTV